MTLDDTGTKAAGAASKVLQRAWRALGRFHRRMPWSMVIACIVLSVASPVIAATYGEFARRAGAEGMVFLGTICLIAYLAVRSGKIYAQRARTEERDDLRDGLPWPRRMAMLQPGTADLVAEYGDAVVRAARAASPSGADVEALRESARDLAARSTPRQWQTLRRRAEHEAAHTVVAHQLGAVINGVWATEENHLSIGGATDSTVAGLGATGVEHEWASALMCLAGTVWDQDHQIADQGARSDMNVVAGLLSQILLWGTKPRGYGGEMTYDSLLAAAAEQTRQILTDNGTLVHAVADRIEANPDEPLTEHDLSDLWEEE